MGLPAKVTPFIHHDVFRLDVPVHDSFRMGGGQRAGHLHGNLQRFTQYLRLTVHVPAQSHSIYELLGNEMERVIVSDLMNGDDVGMIQS